MSEGWSLRLAYKMVESGHIKSVGDGSIQIVVTPEELNDKGEEKDE